MLDALDLPAELPLPGMTARPVDGFVLNLMKAIDANTQPPQASRDAVLGVVLWTVFNIAYQLNSDCAALMGKTLPDTASLTTVAAAAET